MTVSNKWILAVQNFVEVYDMAVDPFQLKNIAHLVDPKLLVELNKKLLQLSVCRGLKCHQPYYLNNNMLWLCHDMFYCYNYELLLILNIVTFINHVMQCSMYNKCLSIFLLAASVIFSHVILRPTKIEHSSMFCEGLGIGLDLGDEKKTKVIQKYTCTIHQQEWSHCLMKCRCNSMVLVCDQASVAWRTTSWAR